MSSGETAIPDDAIEAAARALAAVPAFGGQGNRPAVHRTLAAAALSAALPALRRHIADEIEAAEKLIGDSGGSVDFTSGMYRAARMVRGDDNA